MLPHQPIPELGGFLKGQAHRLGSQHLQRPQGCPERARGLRIPMNRREQLAGSRGVWGSEGGLWCGNVPLTTHLKCETAGRCVSS